MSDKSVKPVMTWFKKLYENPDNLARFFAQALDSYSFRDHCFNGCLEELPIFEELGMKRASPLACDCPCDCYACELCFLTNPSVYNITTSEGDAKNGK